MPKLFRIRRDRGKGEPKIKMISSKEEKAMKEAQKAKEEKNNG